MLRTRVLKTSDELASVRPQWQALLDRTPEATPFQSPAWILSWLETLGRSRQPWVWTAWMGEDLVGVSPMVRSRGPFARLTPMGKGVSDMLDPLFGPEFRGELEARWVEELEAAGVGLVDLHQLRVPPTGLTGWAMRPQAQALVLDLPGSFEAYLGMLGKSLRTDVVRGGKLLGARGLRLSRVPVDSNADAFAAFLELHAARWRARKLPGAFALPGIPRFHRRWLQEAGEMARFFMLEDGDGPAGIVYALSKGPTTFFYQSGFRSVGSGVSPGTLLVAEAIRVAIAEGQLVFDFLRGDEPYKRRWKPQRTVTHWRAWHASAGLAGVVASAAVGAGHRVEAGIRARLEMGGTR